MRTENLEYAHLQEMMDDFNRLTNIRISYWNSAGEKMIMAPSTGDSLFCRELRKAPRIDDRCRACDKEALANAHRYEHRLYQFRCSAGMKEFVYPVFYHNTLLGYFMYGQVRNHDVDVKGKALRETLYSENGMNPGYMQQLYEKLPVIEDENMLSAGRMLASMANYAYLNGFIGDYSTPLTERVEKYIQMQYMNPINIDSACSFFNVSRSHLSHTIQKGFNSTFIKLLNAQRVENVRKCLENGQTIQEAALNSGFQSVNYMTRVFKQIAGVTPNQSYNRQK